MAFDWTQTNIGHLREMWGKGMVASAIALALGPGCTKNAVIGKAHRLKLFGRPNPVANALRCRIANATTCAEKRARKERAVTRAEPLLPLALPLAQPPVNVQPQEVPLVPDQAVDSEPTRPVRFADLKPDMCKWISGPTIRFRAQESLACGAPVVEGRPWCSAHCEKATDRRKTDESRDGFSSINPWSSQARRVA